MGIFNRKAATSGRFVRRDVLVTARQVDTDGIVGETGLVARTGMWVITHQSGATEVMNDDVFRQSYEQWLGGER